MFPWPIFSRSITGGVRGDRKGLMGLWSATGLGLLGAYFDG
jgi:hypothetical protein